MASNKHIKQTPEERAEFLRARRRGFSGPLMFVVVIVAVIFVMSVVISSAAWLAAATTSSPSFS